MTFDLQSASALVAQLSTDPSNAAVLDHLTQVLQAVIRERPANALAIFEELSLQVKQRQQTDGKHIETDKTTLKQNNSTPHLLQSSTDSINTELANELNTSLTLLHHFHNKTESELASEEAANIEPLIVPDYVPDLCAQAELFRQAGVALEQSEVLTLQASIEQFAAKNEAIQHIRFWGKIYTTTQPYYIVETRHSAIDEITTELTERWEKKEHVLQEEDSEEQVPTLTEQLEQAEIESLGVVHQCNEFVYYATTHPCQVESWLPLPIVTPKQIRLSRHVKRYLTGDFKAQVHGLPRFNWSEAHLLRTQIARITHSTTVAPLGSHTADENDASIVIVNEEYSGEQRSTTLLSADRWIHTRLKLLQQGRVDNFVDDITQHDDESEEVEAARLAKEEAAKEKIVGAARSLSEDVLGKRDKSAWTFRLSHVMDTGFQRLQSNTTTVTESEESSAQPLNSTHAVASAHSLLWPGAVSVSLGKTYLSIYVGYGLKHSVYKLKAAKLPRFQVEWNEMMLCEQQDVSKPPKKEKVKKSEADTSGTDETEDEDADEDEAEEAASTKKTEQELEEEEEQNLSEESEAEQ